MEHLPRLDELEDREDAEIARRRLSGPNERPLALDCVRADLRLLERLESKLGHGTGPRPHGSVKPVGSDRLYRFRVGDRRIVYEVRDAVLVAVVVRVAYRREVYRAL